MTRNEIKERFPHASEAFVRANLDPDSVPPSPKLERSVQHEPVAADARKAADARRRLVIVKSFRARLCDERNLCDKYFVDALVRAGILVDDSPEWAKIEVYQVKVDSKAEERTEIQVYDDDSSQ